MKTPHVGEEPHVGALLLVPGQEATLVPLQRMSQVTALQGRDPKLVRDSAEIARQGHKPAQSTSQQPVRNGTHYAMRASQNSARADAWRDFGCRVSGLG